MGIGPAAEPPAGSNDLRRLYLFLTVIAVLTAAAAAVVQIKISPATLVEGGSAKWVTVNTDIPYGQVDRASLTLNGVPVAWTKADNRGELVAKFHQADIEATVEPPSATLTLAGSLIDGTSFASSDTIAVIER